MEDLNKQDGLGRIQSNIHGQNRKYWIMFITIKLLHCIGLFEAYALLKTMHIIQFLCLAKLLSAGVYLVLQKPFSTGRRIDKKQWGYIFRHAMLGIISNILWLFSLTLCGPLRTALVFEHDAPILVAMFLGLFNQKGNHARTRGSLLFCLGILCLLLFDNDSMMSQIASHPEGRHTSAITHFLYSMLSFVGVADHKRGILLLVFVLLLKVAQNGYTKKVSVHVGGPKRLHALSTAMSAALLLPWSILMYLTGVADYNLFQNFFWFVFVVLILFVVDHFGQAVAVSKLDQMQVSKVGYITTALTALFLGFQWANPAVVVVSKQDNGMTTTSKEHMISGGVVVSTIFFILSADILSWPPPKSQKGSFIGYSSEGSPLYRYAGDVLQMASKSSFGTVAKGFLDRVLQARDSRHIFYFLCINLSFAFVELGWGAWSNSLSLVSDSFHMLFDCTALILGLVAAVMAKWKPTRLFPYGYGRVEVLSGFVNGLFLLVVAVFLLYEAFQRLFDPPPINTDQLMTVAVIGLVVNLVGVFVFSHNHHRGHSHGHDHHHGDDHHHHGNSNANMKGVYLHVLADLLGSIGVIVSSFFVERYGMLVADPICTMIVAVLILSTVWPLLRDSFHILSMCAPPHLERHVNQALSKVMAVEGVESYRSCRVWLHTDDEVVAVISVYVQPHVIEQRIITQVVAIFREFGINSTTVQVEKDDFYEHMSGLVEGDVIDYQQILKTGSRSGSESDGEYTKMI